MKTTIWKYELTSEQTDIDIPEGGSILCVQTQNLKPHLWIEVNPDNNTTKRSFIIIGTGEPVFNDSIESKEYIGTFQLQNGALVYHVFELV